jgi:hypothetical protein
MTAADITYRRTTVGLRCFDTPEIRQMISAVLEAASGVETWRAEARPPPPATVPESPAHA